MPAAPLRRYFKLPDDVKTVDFVHQIDKTASASRNEEILGAYVVTTSIARNLDRARRAPGPLLMVNDQDLLQLRMRAFSASNSASLRTPCALSSPSAFSWSMRLSAGAAGAGAGAAAGGSAYSWG